MRVYGRKVFLVALFILFTIPSLVSAGTQTFNTPGTFNFTVPAGVTQVYVTGSGVGGDGGDEHLSTVDGRNYSGGGGGSAGSVINQVLFVTPGNSYAIGVGEVGGTSFGSLLTLTNGQNAILNIGGAGGSPNGMNGYNGDSVQSGTVGPPGDFSVIGAGGGNSLLAFGGNGGTASFNVMGECLVDPSAPGWQGSGGGGTTYCYQAGRQYRGSIGDGGAPFLTITWADPTVGTVNVSSNIAGASWTVTGPATLTGSGTSASYTNRPTGAYTITWNPVAGYTTPASSSQTLMSGGTIAFSGNYTASSPFMSNANFTATPDACGSITLSLTSMDSGSQWYVDARDNGTSIIYSPGTTASWSYTHSSGAGGTLHAYTLLVTDNWGNSRSFGPLNRTAPPACGAPTINVHF